MPLLLKRKSEGYTIPDGLCEAVCIGVSDLGIQNGKYGTKHQVALTFETEHRRDFGEGEKPATISRIFTASLHEKSALWCTMGSLIGDDEEVDLLGLVGVPCLLNVVHREDKARLDKALLLPKDREPLKPEGDTWRYDVWDGSGGDFSKLPPWLQEIAEKAENFEDDEDGL
jgi:hypothetical protein